MKNNKKNIIIISLLILFSIMYTIFVKTIDVRQIGPNNSSVGFSLINEFFNNIIRENKFWYYLTEILGIISIILMFTYAFIAFIKLIKEKSISKVDKELIVLGIFYIIVLIVYILFEKIVINYRPVLMNNTLEASYPSSHTMLCICIFISSIIINKKIFNDFKFTGIINTSLFIMAIVAPIGRLLAKVHWFSDILGGIIISVTLLYIFNSVINLLNKE